MPGWQLIENLGMARVPLLRQSCPIFRNSVNYRAESNQTHPRRWGRGGGGRLGEELQVDFCNIAWPYISPDLITTDCSLNVGTHSIVACCNLEVLEGKGIMPSSYNVTRCLQLFTLKASVTGLSRALGQVLYIEPLIMVAFYYTKTTFSLSFLDLEFPNILRMC
jgi:hypothetical protein